MKLVSFFSENLLVKSRAGKPEPGVFVSLEPEPLKKKAGAGAAWKKSQEPKPEPLKY